MRCPCCTTAMTPERTVWDDRHGEPGTFIVWRCPACAHRSLGESARNLDPIRLYSERYPRRHFCVDSWRPSQPTRGARGWLDGARALAHCWVRPGSHVLDVGCGWGETLGYLRARGCTVAGAEADSNLRRIADLQGFDVRVGPFSADDWSGYRFDTIVLNQVLEHLPDPIKTLSDLHRLLSPDGTVIATTPNTASLVRYLTGSRWIHWHAPYHLHLFSHGSLRAAFQRAGFGVAGHLDITPSAWYQYQLVHLGVRPARPGMRAGFWNPDVGMGVGERLWTRLILQGSRVLPLPSLLARMADALQLGDNQLLIARASG